jgi:mRNA turnover protein 4
MFFGRVSVMALSLGNSPEKEYKPGLHKIATQLHGQVGLFFTSWDPKETLDYFHSIKKPDFARAGSIATEEVSLPSGPLTPVASAEDIAEGIKPNPFPASMEPHLRKLGLSTRLEKGVITMGGPQTVCRKGDTLTAEQAQILKLLGVKMSVFRLALRYMWDKETGEVKEHDGALDHEVEEEDAGKNGEEEDDDHDDEMEE